MNDHQIPREQIEADVIAILREVAHRHGAEVTFNFDVEQPDEGLGFSVKYDKAWKRKRHAKFCSLAICAALGVQWMCGFLLWLKLAPAWTFLTATGLLAVVCIGSFVYAYFFAPKLANPDAIYREARKIVRKKYGKETVSFFLIP